MAGADPAIFICCKFAPKGEMTKKRKIAVFSRKKSTKRLPYLKEIDYNKKGYRYRSFFLFAAEEKNCILALGAIYDKEKG